jgi:hypothetical protein
MSLKENFCFWRLKKKKRKGNVFAGGFSRVEQVLDATIQAIDNVYMMYQDDPRYNMYPRLPRTKSRRYGHFQHWANLAHEIIKVKRNKVKIAM